MFPCGRRVHLHKSIVFKQIFEQNKTNHKNDTMFDPKTTETHFRNIRKLMRKHLKQYYPNSAKLSDVGSLLEPFGSSFGAIRMTLSSDSAICSWLLSFFFWTSGWYPLGPILSPKRKQNWSNLTASCPLPPPGDNKGVHVCFLRSLLLAFACPI